MLILSHTHRSRSHSYFIHFFHHPSFFFALSFGFTSNPPPPAPPQNTVISLNFLPPPSLPQIQKKRRNPFISPLLMSSVFFVTWSRQAQEFSHTTYNPHPPSPPPLPSHLCSLPRSPQQSSLPPHFVAYVCFCYPPNSCTLPTVMWRAHNAQSPTHTQTYKQKRRETNTLTLTPTPPPPPLPPSSFHFLPSPFHPPSISLPSPFHLPSIPLPSPFHPPSISLPSPFHPPSIPLPSPLPSPAKIRLSFTISSTPPTPLSTRPTRVLLQKQEEKQTHTAAKTKQRFLFCFSKAKTSKEK